MGKITTNPVIYGGVVIGYVHSDGTNVTYTGARVDDSGKIVFPENTAETSVSSTIENWFEDVFRYVTGKLPKEPTPTTVPWGIRGAAEWLIPSANAGEVSENVDRDFTAAARYTAPIRRDPLTLDLDGDGLETVGTSAGILFDQTGSGVKQGTGWVKADDGFLVLDRNGNGTIDSGRELFGDSTIKSNGQTALDGFDALADLDSNADGKITSADTQFNSLRVWRDLNQDGISQTAELATLASLDITGINVTSTEHSQVLANGNQIADLGTYTRTDGSTGNTGEVSGTLGDINLGNLDSTATRAQLQAANDGEWRAIA